MKRALYYGKITHDGTTARFVLPDNPHLAQEAWEELGGVLKRKGGKLIGEIYISILIEEKDCGVQNNDRGYYHGVMLPAITRGFNAFGNKWSKQKMHDYLKGRFVEPDKDGKRSTETLGEHGYREFLKQCDQFAVEDLHIIIPPRRKPGVFPEEER